MTAWPACITLSSVRSSPRARAAFLLLYGAFLAWQIDRWFFTPHGVISSWRERHASRPLSAGSPRGLAQTFEMGADGLDGVWLQPRAGPRMPEGELVVDLVQLHGETRTRIERVVLAAADVHGHDSIRVPFTPVRRSRGQVFEIDMRHVRAGQGPAIEFHATRDDVVRRARLFADGVEQWGDLVFETSARRATLPYWLAEILRPWPAWVRAWPTVVTVVLFFNVLLAWACALAVGATGSIVEHRTDTAPALPSGMVVAQGAMTVICVLVIAGIVVTLWPTPAQRTIDLIAALPAAHLESTWDSLHAGISAEPVVFQGKVHRSIVAMPTSRMTWTVDVPKGAVLHVGAAMRPDMWERESDGVQMRVAVESAAGRTVGAELTLFPMGVPDHRKLFPVTVPIHPWAGQRVRLILETTPERWGNAVNDVPVWVEPRIEWPRTPSVGEARIVEP